jgi:hypothetical protein
LSIVAVEEQIVVATTVHQSKSMLFGFVMIMKRARVSEHRSTTNVLFTVFTLESCIHDTQKNPTFDMSLAFEIVRAVLTFDRERFVCLS